MDSFHNAIQFAQLWDCDFELSAEDFNFYP